MTVDEKYSFKTCITISKNIQFGFNSIGKIMFLKFPIMVLKHKKY